MRRTPSRFGGGDHRQRVGRRQVQDVGAGTGPAGPFDDLGDGHVLGAARAGGQERWSSGRRRGGARGRSRRESSAWTIISESKDLSSAMSCFHLVASRCGNSSTPECSRKHLKPKTPVVVQRPQVVLVAGTAPPQKPTSTNAWSRPTSRFELQGLHVDGGRDAVQRHVDDGGDAAGRRRPGGGREALPLGAAGLIDVHVGVHEARHEGLVVGEFDDFGAGEAVAERLDRDDHAAADADFAGGDAGGGQHPLPAEDEVVGFFRH